MNKFTRALVVALAAVWSSSGRWGDVAVGGLQFGCEITSSSGGKNFTTNSYSVSGG